MYVTHQKVTFIVQKMILQKQLQRITKMKFFNNHQN